ncbi:MAG TPA: HAMP domain-containing protein [Asticcacaulis sp.]|nr:HAMP domain-containing protein [Asticcacaulis sp.]
MTIKAKILSLVAAFVFMVFAITVLAFFTMRHYDRVIADYARASDNAFKGEHLNLLLSQETIDIRNIYTAKTPEELTLRTTALNRHASEIQTLLTDWKAQLRPNEIPQFKRVEADSRTMIKALSWVANVARTQSPKAAETIGITDKNIAWREAFQGRVDVMVSGIQDQLKARAAKVQAYQTTRKLIYILFAGGGTLLLLIASLWIAIKSIANPLKEVTGSIIRISEGAYDTPIPAVTGQDEISRLWAALAILKAHAIEAKRLNDQKLELHLD